MLIRCSRHSFGSESQFRCRTHNSVTNFNSLQTTQLWQRIIISVQNTRFDSECEFAADNSVLAANHNFAAKHTIRQRINNSVSTANHKFAADNSAFAAADTVSAANHNFAAEHTIRQQMLICCRRHSFDSESQFHSRTHDSAANANSLQITQFRQRITISLQTTQFRQRMLIRCSRLSFDSKSQIRCRQLSFGS